MAVPAAGKLSYGSIAVPSGQSRNRERTTMNNSAYLATGKVIALMQGLSRIKVITHGKESIPTGSIIFVVNHFTRIETLLLPYHIYTQTRVPVWSLADQKFF
jgi:1-acyl-sn-glycerol-3-phosphate acyltransferase